MTDFKIVRDVFLEARDRSADERRAVLDARCGADAELRAEVESLLASHDTDDARFDTESTALPRTFGAFELLEIVGHGGMGTVYKARQAMPSRLVALKVIRPGVVARSAVGRFRREADVLASLQHSGIAQIFEAGSVDTEHGAQQYFAMELIDGTSLDAHVRGEALGVEERLRLMIQVCEAVHHAHEKGVVHRDLKPGNILVDRAGQVKVLDFGIARATNQDARVTTLATSPGQLLGTVPYMSPEQITGHASGADRRSDIYALGVVLYEILANRLPHDLVDRPIPEAVRIVRDVTPPRLGTVDTRFRGDVETIVGKCMELERGRRYATAQEVADDMRRHLAHQPIVARPPTIAYQVRLFARRHRAMAAGLAIAAVTLLTAGSVVVGLAISERDSTRRADRARTGLKELITLPDPHFGMGSAVDPAYLDQVAARLADDADLPREDEAETRLGLGQTYLSLQRFSEAERHLTRAAALYREFAPESEPYARTLAHLGITRSAIGRHDAATEAFQSARALYAKLDPLVYLDICESEALNLLKDEKFAEAEPIIREHVRAIRERPEDIRTVRALRTLGRLERGLGNHAAQRDAHEEASALAERLLEPGHPIRIHVLTDIARACEALGDSDGAAESAAAAAAMADRFRQPGSYDWKVATGNNWKILARLGRRAEALEVLEFIRSRYEGALGRETEELRAAMEALASDLEAWREHAWAANLRAGRGLDDGPADREQPAPVKRRDEPPAP